MAELLIVDDDPGIRAYLDMLFRLEGHRVHVAPDAGSAAAVLATETIDLVVLDIVMPGRNGLDLLGDIAADVVVVLHTGESSCEPLVRSVAAVVAKPSTLDDLVRTVDDALTSVSVAA